jgi:hypothetical protein
VSYSVYDSLEDAHQELENHEQKIQCVVGQGHLPFGTAQFPKLNDYADRVDTLAFLLA